MEKSINQAISNISCKSIDQSKNSNTDIYSKKDFLNFKTFYQIFFSPKAVEKIAESKSLFSSPSNEDDSIREQNLNIQIKNYITGDF